MDSREKPMQKKPMQKEYADGIIALSHCRSRIKTLHTKFLGIKKAITFTGHRSKSSIGISSIEVKRLFSG